MDSLYVIETLARQRLADAAAWAERERLLSAGRPPERGLREIVGGALIRLGSTMVGDAGRLRRSRLAPE